MCAAAPGISPRAIAGQTVWVDTYVDANTGKLVTTCATPLYDAEQRFVGVLGFDLLLDTIQQDLLQLDMGQAGYAFLINDQGKVLVRPDLEVGQLTWNQPFTAENLLQTDDPRLHDIVERMTKGRQGIERLFYQGGNIYLAVCPDHQCRLEHRHGHPRGRGRPASTGGQRGDHGADRRSCAHRWSA